LILQDDLLLYPPIVVPCLGILVPTPLEPEVGDLARDRRNFGEHLGFHVVKLLLIHHIVKHNYDFNGGKTSFNQEDDREYYL